MRAAARRDLRNTILLWLALAVPGGDVPAEGEAAGTRRNILLIAGLKSHGPEGNGIHDYAWSARLIKTLLETSTIRDRVNVSLHLNGWPASPAAFEDAATIMIIADGRDGPIGHEAPHLATPERVRLVDELVKRGCGVVTFHFSTFAPDALGEKAIEWYGGYFDWETDGERKWHSRITTTEARTTPASPGHPVLRGVMPFTIREEFYHDIRFREGDPGWTPIWSVEALPAAGPHGKVVAWAVERGTGSRGFATTCGHFYANWREPGFRKTVLNGLAWAAHVPIPAAGVEAAFPTHSEIAAHLREPEIAEVPDPGAAGPDPYDGEPYWYLPGHPVKPAEARGIRTLPGFHVERIFTVPESWGSWTAITADHRGRLICAAQHGAGLYRVAPPEVDDPAAPARVEPLKGAAERIGWSHGLLAAFDSLYVTVSEENDAVRGGVYRLRDSDGDDQYDETTRLFELEGDGEHGPHGIVVGPDEQSLYMICGNGTRLPEGLVRRRPSPTQGIDRLMPPGCEPSEYSPQGFVLRFRPDGGDLELVSSGLRNSFDLAFNRAGDLFTFDSDMEWDFGAPWYRPTRICHLVSGGEFGWRDDAANWPEYFEDGVSPVVDVGPASPTGVAFGYGARFPARYRRALYACDWTFATIHAIHLEPSGATYRATVEEFVGGNGLPVTDLAIGADGTMYFIVGGRRLGSALYRVRYAGEDAAGPVADAPLEGTEATLHGLRRRLEELHGRRDEGAIAAAWPHLGHDDRAIRFAARVAIESQPVDAWRQRSLEETGTSARILGLIALARRDAPANQTRVIAALGTVGAGRLPADRLLGWLRAHELALARGSSALEPERESIRRRLLALFPHDDQRVNRELSRLLCFLGEPSMVPRLLERMAADEGERPLLGAGNFVRNPKYGRAIRDILQSAPLVDRMHYAEMLLWIENGWTPAQRSEYFRLIADAAANTKGGHWYGEFWKRIREAALERMPEESRRVYAAIGADPAPASRGDDLPRPRGPGKDWELGEILAGVTEKLRDRDFEDGKKMFHAAQCIVCHRFNGEGSSVGPDLSAIGQRFTVRDLLDATLNPSKAVSDQYRVSLLVTADGRTLSGRVVSRDDRQIALAMDLKRPGQVTRLDAGRVTAVHSTGISTMPEELLDPLNLDEVLNLVAYLISGGDARHPVFRR